MGGPRAFSRGFADCLCPGLRALGGKGTLPAGLPPAGAPDFCQIAAGLILHQPLSLGQGLISTARRRGGPPDFFQMAAGAVVRLSGLVPFPDRRLPGLPAAGLVHPRGILADALLPGQPVRGAGPVLCCAPAGLLCPVLAGGQSLGLSPGPAAPGPLYSLYLSGGRRDCWPGWRAAAGEGAHLPASPGATCSLWPWAQVWSG